MTELLNSSKNNGCDVAQIAHRCAYECEWRVSVRVRVPCGGLVPCPRLFPALRLYLLEKALDPCDTV